MSFDISVECRSIGEIDMQCRFSYQPTIGRLWTDISTDISEAFCSTSSRPILSEVSGKYRWTIGKLSAKYRRGIGEQKTISVDAHLVRYIDRLSPECRPAIDRHSTDISTDIAVETTYGKHDPNTLLFTYSTNILVHMLTEVFTNVPS